jgi:hypothetical protein
MHTERIIRNEHGQLLQSDVTVAPDPASSVEISTNAKGQAQVTVKVYDTNPVVAAEKAVALYRQVTAAVSQAA